ncbi:MAG: hypothetical protein AB7I27_14010 [Bacteriovoracaceae bacterium]
MVDYSNARILRIENVDLPIHILGVEAPAMLGCFWIFLGTLVINPIVAPFSALGFAFIARYFFSFDQKGLPLTYSLQFQELAKRTKLTGMIFPSIQHVCLSKEEYRGEN